MSVDSVERVVREYTLHRRRLSALLYLATLAEEEGRGREAFETIEAWRRGRLGFREALEKLEKLAGREISGETRRALIEGRLPPDDE